MAVGIEGSVGLKLGVNSRGMVESLDNGCVEVI